MALSMLARPPISRATALARGNNNFDLLRLLAALLVIVGHARALTLVPQNSSDFVMGLLHFDYAGSLAVKFFSS